MVGLTCAVVILYSVLAFLSWAVQSNVNRIKKLEKRIKELQ